MINLLIGLFTPVSGAELYASSAGFDRPWITEFPFDSGLFGVRHDRFSTRVEMPRRDIGAAVRQAG